MQVNRASKKGGATLKSRVALRKKFREMKLREAEAAQTKPYKNPMNREIGVRVLGTRTSQRNGINIGDYLTIEWAEQKRGKNIQHRRKVLYSNQTGHTTLKEDRPMESEEKDMAVRKEDIARVHQATPEKRSLLIRAIANQICDANDEGMRRLSKN